MPKYAYERLSAQDNSFLLMERENVYMHVGSTQIYEAEPLRTADGGIDIEKFKGAIHSVMHLIPRYREKLKWIPLEDHPVWVDDEHFNLDYHIRHTSLPKPGDDEQLKKLAARVMAQQLDRAKPLWEMWLIEGLQGDRFAVVSKLHHCMIDGSSGVDMARVLMSISPDSEWPQPLPYLPRPTPSGLELMVDEWRRRLSLPLVALRGFREFRSHAEDLGYEVRKRVQAVTELLGYAVRPASDTPINGPLTPHRRVDWISMPLEEVKLVRRALDCTVNDVVLSTVAGAVRSYFQRRRVNPDKLDFRVSAPVSVRSEEERGQLGNRVSSWIVRLPVHIADAIARLDTINEVTQKLKHSQQALGVEMLMAAAEWAPAQLLSLGSQATSGPINMIVTNVPGPQIPLYMLGSKLIEMFPQVPLLANTGLGVALFSYDGRLFWGFNADPALVPDLPEFVAAIEASFGELRQAATLRAVAVQRSPAASRIQPPGAKAAAKTSGVQVPSSAASTARPPAAAVSSAKASPVDSAASAAPEAALEEEAEQEAAS